MRGVLPIVLVLAGCRQAEAPTQPAAAFTSATIALPAETAALPATPAGELVTNACTACHSAEMIQQQPVMDAKKWAATVTKMREAYKASIAPEDDAALVAALVVLQAPAN